ncbi:hypothetical protein [Massilia varians]|uniref:hypothetical protein n=1 Tax=Massilia varians TaxID=457921 RepID=UPI0025546438|nr:hypothetical protein [Massilia varians]MDK6079654.1 hypothetical protein [Massilia varians]
MKKNKAGIGQILAAHTTRYRMIKLDLRFPVVASIVLTTSFVLMPVARAATGGGIPPERHQACMTYGAFATKVWQLKNAGYDENSAGAKLIGRTQAMSTPALAKKILDITSYVYSKPMSEAGARSGIYDLCTSGKLDEM